MPAGYGNDTTASNTDPSTGQSIAQSLAQIFSTGVTAYVDGQAIQAGYQINDPRYYQSGYPAGVGIGYSPYQAGVSVQAQTGSKGLLLLGIGVLALFLLMKR
jgi:hypothetical protein